MTVTDPTAAPMRQRRNNWNNWIATHAQMRPEAVALRFMGQETTWSQLHERAERLAAGPRRALQLTKQALTAATLAGVDDALARENTGQRELLVGPDFAEGARAMLEKRRPRFA